MFEWPLYTARSDLKSQIMTVSSLEVAWIDPWMSWKLAIPFGPVAGYGLASVPRQDT